MGALALTAQPGKQEAFRPLMPGASYVPRNDLDALRAAVSERTCAIAIEIVQGECGVYPLDDEFVRLARTSPHINQSSGVSVRCSIANAENVVSAAERRGIVQRESMVVARVDDPLAFVCWLLGPIIETGEAKDLGRFDALFSECLEFFFWL